MEGISSYSPLTLHIYFMLMDLHPVVGWNIGLQEAERQLYWAQCISIFVMFLWFEGPKRH